MTPAKVNFKVYQGSTFSEVLRWESSNRKYATITGITQAAPCVVTSASHGIPNGWRAKITNVGGMKEINSSEVFHSVKVLSSNTLELNSINSIGFTAYTSGGVLEFNEPVDLTGYTARMQIRERVDSTEVIDSLTTVNGKILIDNVEKTVTINVNAVSTSEYTFSTAVYSLELESPGGVVTPFMSGTLSLIKEVTR